MSSRASRGSTPLERRAQVGRQQLDDLAPARMSAQPHFAEDQLPVNADLQASPGSRLQQDVPQQRSPGSKDLRRQTDGFIDVVSGNAELDLDAVLWIDCHT